MGHRELLATGRVAIYARYSSDKQSCTSIDDQVARCRKYVEDAGGTVHDEHVFVDAAVSGASLERAGWEALMKLVDSAPKRIDAIVTEDISRVTRDFADWGTVFRDLRFRDVALVSVQEGTSTGDKSSKLAMHMKALIADQYLDDLRDKTHRGMVGHANRGMSTGLLPYGFVSIADEGRGPGRRVVIDETRAEVVRTIFRMRAEGASFGRIASVLNERHVEPPRGKGKRRREGWVGSAIRAMLTNEKYIGVSRWNQRRFVKVPGTNKRVARLRPEAEHTVREDESLRIVPQVDWDAVNAQFRANEVKYAGTVAGRRGRPSSHLLSGLLFCGACGAVMTIHGGARDRRYYRCDDRAKRGTCTVRISVRESIVRERVLEAVGNLLKSPPVVDLVRRRLVEERAKRAAQGRTGLVELKRRLTETDTQLANLVDSVAKGLVSRSITEAIGKLEVQADSLRLEIERSEAEVTAPVRLPTLEQAVARIQQLDRLLEADVARGRQALSALLKDGRIHLFLEDGGYVARATLFPGALFVAPAPQTKNDNSPSGGPEGEWYKGGCGGPQHAALADSRASNGGPNCLLTALQGQILGLPRTRLQVRQRPEGHARANPQQSCPRSSAPAPSGAPQGCPGATASSS